MQGWRGPTCNEDVNECLSMPCKNGGQCTNTLGSYTCLCVPGYQGVNCDQDINECLSNPCWNGARCNNLVNAFSCTCVPGYTGRFCEIDINECASNPCRNGGVCIDRVNGFSCRCAVNWQGTFCDHDVNECAMGLSRCSVKAYCTNTFGSYTCTCNSGYYGDGFTCKEKRLFDYRSDIRITQRLKDFTSPLVSVPMRFPFGYSFYSNLYFTDNGVIMFQRYFYEPMYIYNYPYGYFYSNDYSRPPMIAVFWADADMSQSGELYYQTYDFQQSPYYETSFKTQLETEIQTYFNKQITASWAIKITWEQVRPYPSYYFTTANTNTYQAVLVTDGIYSFCLIRFDDGGMNWRYEALPTYYLPKMGYFSGEPRQYNYASSPALPAFNDPQTSSGNLQIIYMPDQYKGYNTNRNGYWAYRLEANSVNTRNSWQQCLSWYYNEPNPNWSFYSPPCPCSFWQAIFDSSFTSSNRLNDYYFPRKSSDNYISFQSAFSSWYGGGTRCDYYWSGSLIYGEKERFLPTPWIYDNSLYWWWYPQYRNYFWSTTLPALRSQYQANEVDPYENCCTLGSSYLCDLYSQKRPRDYCYGYIPPRIGFFFGDPHINTLDGVKYTFNGLGEFTLVNVKNDNGTMFLLQGRTARAGNNGTSQAPNFVALAAEINNETMIEWQLSDENTTFVKVNGTEFPLTVNSTSLGMITLEITTEKELKASFVGGISVAVTAKFGSLSFVATLDSSYQNKTEGLLGQFNGDVTDDLMYSYGTNLSYNGVKLPNDSAIFEMGMTWKTTPKSSIFSYNSTNNESWYSYNNNSFVPLFYNELLQIRNKTLIDSANATCKGNDECIFDILSTGNLAIGEATLGVANSATAQESSMNNFPPNITGPSTIYGTLNKVLMVNYTVTDQNNDPVVLTLQTNSKDITIDADGTLLWNATSLDPFNVTIEANDSKSVTNFILTLVLCNCSNNGECLFNKNISIPYYANFKMAGCNCSDAWTGIYCEDDFDGCLENRCFVNNTCNDTKAPDIGFTCGPCPSGMIGDGIDCSDIDECYLNISNCEQICNNIPRGYNCSCREGYTVSETNSSKCEDINECQNTTLNLCGENTECTNLPGNYSCQCKDGYTGDPTVLCVGEYNEPFYLSL
ncbi:mucin-like protein [Xenopus laevis]|uniref:Mucin-like protein n=1 Tax=Xenopus laevis TaxID=8355 RepID=A0A8J0U5Z3_XENLA|nr:mucin-like protein [Xenopus laevis]